MFHFVAKLHPENHAEVRKEGFETEELAFEKACSLLASREVFACVIEDDCRSAQDPDADRRRKLLTTNGLNGSKFEADQHSNRMKLGSPLSNDPPASRRRNWNFYRNNGAATRSTQPDELPNLAVYRPTAPAHSRVRRRPHPQHAPAKRTPIADASPQECPRDRDGSAPAT